MIFFADIPYIHSHTSKHIHSTHSNRKFALASCNILNFGPNTYRQVFINYDDYLDVLVFYWVEDPTAYEHHDLFYIYWE